MLGDFLDDVVKIEIRGCVREFFQPRFAKKIDESLGRDMRNGSHRFGGKVCAIRGNSKYRTTIRVLLVSECLFKFLRSVIVTRITRLVTKL